MNKKQNAGRQGGLATFRKHGKEHMQKIGRRGAKITHSRYRMHPFGLSGWAYINRETGEVKATWR